MTPTTAAETKGGGISYSQELRATGVKPVEPGRYEIFFYLLTGCRQMIMPSNECVFVQMKWIVSFPA